MNPLHLTVATALMSMAMREIIQETTLTLDDILQNKKKTDKSIRREIGVNILEHIDLADVFRALMGKLKLHTKSEVAKYARKADSVLVEIADLGEDDYYYQIVLALYVAKSLEPVTLMDRLLVSKLERIYDRVLSIISQNKDRDTIRKSIRLGEVVVSYLIEGKQIPFSIKKQRPKWAREALKMVQR